MIEKFIYISILSACITEFILFILGFVDYAPNLEYRPIFDFFGKRLQKFKEKLCPFCFSVWVTWAVFAGCFLYLDWSVSIETGIAFFVCPVLEMQILRVLRSIDYY